MKFDRSLLYLVAMLGYISFYFIEKYEKKKSENKSILQIFEIDEEENIMLELKEYIFKKATQNSKEKLSEYELTIYILDLFESTINNYGFYVFLYNQDSINISKIEKALNNINASDISLILKKAIALFDDGIFPINIKERQKQMDSWSNKKKDYCNELDNKFYKCHQIISEMLIEYVMSNKKKFIQEEK